LTVGSASYQLFVINSCYDQQIVHLHLIPRRQCKVESETFFSPLYCLYNMFSVSNQQSLEIWPPTRSSHTRAVTDNSARTPIANHDTSTMNPTTITPLNMSVVPLSTSLTSKKSEKIFCNGYEQSPPKPLSYTPYQTLTQWSGWKRYSFVLPDTPDLQPIKPHPGLNHHDTASDTFPSTDLEVLELERELKLDGS